MAEIVNSGLHIIGSDGKPVYLADFLTTVRDCTDLAAVSRDTGLSADQIEGGIRFLQALCSANPLMPKEEVDATP